MGSVDAPVPSDPSASGRYWFTSPRFRVQPGEDDATNPGRFGKSLAEWLATELAAAGYATEVVAEDWGWCVVCERGDYLSWVGCGNVETGDITQPCLTVTPEPESIVWTTFVEVEVPSLHLRAKLWQWFGRLDLSDARARLTARLDAVLRANPDIHPCAEP